MQITRRIVIAGLLLASVAALLLALARQYQRKAVQMSGWDEPWESRRGVEHTDYNGNPVLIRAPIEDVARALASRTQRWEENVLGREIALEPGRGAFVFRLRGHDWTIIVFDGPVWLRLPEADEQAASALLERRVIDYWVGDTSGTIGYRFYDKGQLQEQFSATEGDASAPDASTFSSRLREIKITEIQNVVAFAAQFLADQDAYEPSISFDYFLGAFRPNSGELVQIVNPGVMHQFGPGRQSRAIPPIERVDYLVLKPSSG